MSHGISNVIIESNNIPADKIIPTKESLITPLTCVFRLIIIIAEFDLNPSLQ